MEEAMVIKSELFNTIPKEDYLELFEGMHKTKPNRILKFLEFKKEDVAKASGIPLASVRYDNRIPETLEERLKEWAILINLIAEHFKGDNAKTSLWFTTVNPLLGYVTPRDMIRFGRFKKLYKFVFNALAENKR